MSQSSLPHIDALLQEHRTIDPPDDFAAEALVSSEEIYQQADEDLEGFWARQAESLYWYRSWTRVLDWNPPWVKWFIGGRLNISVNCLDRHLETHPDRVAYFWEGEPGDERRITYRELYEEVCRFANGLKKIGVRRGDRVAIYLGMIPELPVAMLACARIGAVHSVVFGGFAADSLRDRINDANAEVLITADGGWRRGGIVPLKEGADSALDGCPTIRKAVVVRRTGQDVPMVEGRDIWYHELVSEQSTACEPEEMDSEDPLYILYTSGTTGRPKGILHTTGGYLVGVTATHRLIFDIHPETDVYWCAADIGWVTGHSYIVYGPLANGTTSIMYEGAPDFPDKDRLWSIVGKYGATILYTAPTAIRAFMKWGAEYPERHNLASLRLLGTVGEPINPEAWMWYWKYIGGERCPIVDTWWQTETGMILITPLPGITRLKPGSATRPFPGVVADAVSHDLRRPGSFRRPVLLALRTRHLLDGGRGEVRRGRLLLATGAHRRRHERGGAPALHVRDRIRPGRSRCGGRIGRRLAAAPGGRRSDRRLRHAASQLEWRREAHRRAPRPRGGEDRQDRPATRHRPQRRPAEDPIRQDHAAAITGCRPRSRAGRCDYTGERRGRGGNPNAGRRAAGRGVDRATVAFDLALVPCFAAQSFQRPPRRLDPRLQFRVGLLPQLDEPGVGGDGTGGIAFRLQRLPQRQVVRSVVHWNTGPYA